jgi:histidinol-phosphate/aromatic aminotransferase/cobyric acid decarboxylase-like protein
MTQPISQERITWLRERLKVVEESIRIGTASMYAVQSGGAQRDELQRVVVDLTTERTRIALELRVLGTLVAGSE